MYLRTISRRNGDGSVVRCMQLGHKQWDPVEQQVKAQVIHSFGREDQLDREAFKRLIRSFARGWTAKTRCELRPVRTSGFWTAGPWGAGASWTTSR